MEREVEERSTCRGLHNCQHCSNCCAVLSTMPGRGHYDDHYPPFIGGEREACPRKPSHQGQSQICNTGSRPLGTLLSYLLRESAAYNKVFCKCMVSRVFLILSVLLRMVSLGQAVDTLNCKRRKGPRLLVQIGPKTQRWEWLTQSKDQSVVMLYNAEASLWVPWPEGSVVMGRRIKEQNCCSRQKYCNGNHLAGWGSKSLPSSSHFSSGQNL